jgi:hypothetical protein
VLKVGCTGCLGLTVATAIIAAVLVVIAWRQAEHEDIAERELRRPLGLANGTGEDAAESAPLELTADEPAGTVVLDLRQTTLEIRAGVAGEPARVRARFDANCYQLAERYDEDGRSGAWTYEIEFRRTSASGLITALKEVLSGSRPHIAVRLPPDVPIALDLRVKQGGGEIDLGGLWLDSAEINFIQGGGWIGFSDPLVEPIDRLDISFVQGGGEIEGVGNASPRQLGISFAMGGGDVDLRGPWLRDAEMDIDVKMGGASVWLPRHVDVRGIDQRALSPPQEDEVPRPVLTVNVSSRFGEVEFLD